MSEKKNVNKFIHALGRLEPGERAKLKRNAGQTLNNSRDVMGLFYNKLVSGLQISQWEEETYFLVATLYPFGKQSGQKERLHSPEGGEDPAKVSENKRFSFGHSLRKVRSEKNSSGLDRRVERLLDSEHDQLTFYLRREVHFVTNEGGQIDWACLLEDLLRWQHSDRYVQRRWARDYFTHQPAAEPIN